MPLTTSPESFEFSNLMQIFNFKTGYTVQILAKNKPDQYFTGWAEFRLQSRDARVCFFLTEYWDASTQCFTQLHTITAICNNEDMVTVRHYSSLFV